jgi:hypothetical protein
MLGIAVAIILLVIKPTPLFSLPYSHQLFIMRKLGLQTLSKARPNHLTRSRNSQDTISTVPKGHVRVRWTCVSSTSRRY